MSNINKNKNGSKKGGDRETEVSKMYTKKTLYEHVLEAPDKYIGSIECDTKKMWVYDPDLDIFVNKEILYNAGLYKIFDEIAVNARDHRTKDKTCNEINFVINAEEGYASVSNNGNGIPVVMHKTEKVYVPEMIFGTMLTSGNYDNPDKTTGGKNGEGAKLANIFSKKFIVETIDGEAGKHYIQRFHNNMLERDEPVITKTKEKPFTKITFYPDFEKFGLEKFSPDMAALMMRRAYDIAGSTGKQVKVTLNGRKLPIKSFKDYVKMYYGEGNENEDKININKISVYENPNSDWEVVVAYNPTGFAHSSMVNGIYTPDGGTHVEHVIKKVSEGVISTINKDRKKSLNIKTTDIKYNIMVFINCVVNGPSFNGQAKDKLTKSITKWKSRCELSDEFYKKLLATGLEDKLMDMYNRKEDKELKKTDGKKVTRIRDMSKLDDAHNAGTTKSQEAHLFITEGDSAKTFAIHGITMLGQDNYGAFPIRGKFLNVSSATKKQLINNVEFANIKKIIGLESGVDYSNDKNFKKLRYGHLIILADQDDDGKHIAGLIINLFKEFWPSLLKKPGFLNILPTPIVKVWKGKTKLEFFNFKTYREWKASVGKEISKWSYKYYKGLGTSVEDEAMDHFDKFHERILAYKWEEPEKTLEMMEENTKAMKEESDALSVHSIKSTKSSGSSGTFNLTDSMDKNSESWRAIELAFSKHNSNARKTWLKVYDEDDIVVDLDKQLVTYSDFIHKEVKHYSHQSNIRAIPRLADGFKEAQRKVIYTLLKQGLFCPPKQEKKVAQLAGNVSETTEYHHGESSLEGTIICLAQDYPGSNNINLLYPSGTFGSRSMNGKDAAQSRYIFTYLVSLVKKIFRSEDECILEDLYENGTKIEPKEYYPVIPTVLINGVDGIGTGYSSRIFNYNPLDIVSILKKMIKGKQVSEPIPWYRGFEGTIEKVNDNHYLVKGRYEIIDDKTIRITEVPITGGMSITKYKEFIDSITRVDKEDKRTEAILVDNVHNSNPNKFDFVLTFASNELQKLIRSGTLEKKLKLVANASNTNMHLFDENGIIRKYRSALDIIESFYKIRLTKYSERKQKYIEYLDKRLDIIKYKVKYIKAVNSRKINISKITSEYLLKKFEELKYPKVSISEDSEKSYKYLTDMRILSLTTDKADELQKEFNMKQAELEAYRKKPADEIWLDELKEFETEYNKYAVEYAKMAKARDEKAAKSRARNQDKSKGKRTSKAKK